MTKQEKQIKVLKCLQDACDQVPEVRVYYKDIDFYEKKVTLYATDRAVTTFKKISMILKSGCDEVESINYIYVDDYSDICEVTLK